MAKATAGPDEQMAELRAERERIAGERDGLLVQLRQARVDLAKIPGRKHEAIVAEARGREGESLEDIESDRQRLEAAAADDGRIKALVAAEVEIGEEQNRLIELNLEHYSAKADAASHAALEAQNAAIDALRRAGEARTRAEALWMTVRDARRRLQLFPGPLVPDLDFGAVAQELERRAPGHEPWPGGGPDQAERELELQERYTAAAEDEEKRNAAIRAARGPLLESAE